MSGSEWPAGREAMTSGDAARRGQKWWSADGSDHVILADPWADVECDVSELSDAQRAFLVGDLDQPAIPRMRFVGGVPGDTTGNEAGNAPGAAAADDPYGRSS